MKSVKKWNFLWSITFRFRNKYGDSFCKSPYSFRLREKAVQIRQFVLSGTVSRIIILSQSLLIKYSRKTEGFSLKIYYT